MNDYLRSLNVKSVLAVLVVVLCFGLFLLFTLAKIELPNKDLALMIAGGALGLVGQVVQFFFGSSEGSARKTEILAGPGGTPGEPLRTAVLSPAAASPAPAVHPAPGPGPFPGLDGGTAEDLKRS